MEIFISYHFTTLDLNFNGFGNYVGIFNRESYNGAGKGKFVLDAEKSIAMALHEQYKEKGYNAQFQVKVLNFA